MTESTAIVHVLWARCEQFPVPQFVAAWPDGLVHCYPEWHRELREQAEQEYRDFDDDGPWTFWETIEHVKHPTVVPEVEAHA